MDQRYLAVGAAGIGAFAIPGPSRIAAFGWLGERPSFLLLCVLAMAAFVVIVGFALLAWKVLTRDWPPREAIGLLIIVVAARLTLDVIRMMGFWFI